MRARLACLLLLAATSTATAQSFQISAYLGVQGALDSGVEGHDPGGVGPFDFDPGWDGNSLDNPVYFGFRGTWWRDERSGIALEINHQKVYGDPDTIAARGFERLEFTDGLNLVTVNYMRRFPLGGRMTPYLGAGLGLAIPHVEVETAGGRTFEYQTTGLAAVAIAGLDYALSDRWSVFGEAKLAHARVDADLDNGGRLETSVTTGALNAGLSYHF